MQELELLKKRWKNQEGNLPHLSYDEIYKMLLKKSSSIVKWIFFISIAEILLWTLLALLVPDSNRKFTDDIGLHNMLLVLNIVYYTVFIVFIVIFYLNYRKISATDSVKRLMGNILRTRRTVKYFIFYNVSGTILMLLGLNIFYFLNQDLMFELMVQDYHISPNIDRNQFFAAFFISQLVIGILIIGAILLFYRLVYGILLRRLKKNYHELQKMEA